MTGRIVHTNPSDAYYSYRAALEHTAMANSAYLKAANAFAKGDHGTASFHLANGVALVTSANEIVERLNADVRIVEEPEVV